MGATRASPMPLAALAAFFVDFPAISRQTVIRAVECSPGLHIGGTMPSSYVKALAVVAFALASSLFTASPARADVAWNETVNGELSSNGNAPTNLGTFGPGVHSVIATSGSSDIDNFTFTIPAGAQLQQIINSAYSGIDGTAFIGIQNGSTIDNSGSSLRGYQHFGPGQGNTNANLLPFMGGAPAGPGAYTIWWQQAGSPATVQLDFVVPEPASGVTLALLAATLATSRSRRNAQRA